MKRGEKKQFQARQLKQNKHSPHQNRRKRTLTFTFLQTDQQKLCFLLVCVISCYVGKLLSLSPTDCTWPEVAEDHCGFRLAADVKLKRVGEEDVFKYKVISEGIMIVLFPLEEDFPMVPLKPVDRRSIKYNDLNYRSYFTLRKESFLGCSLVSSRNNIALPTEKYVS